jgi:Fe2+ or Zn2+ uptake regulation protein
MKEGQKHRQCPHCKGKQGFKVLVFLGGLSEITSSFRGKIIDVERNGSDTIHHAVCIECDKLIDIEKLDIENI